MRTTSIPAQITTVEDKIAGNLNLTQVILLVVPVLLSTFVYGVLPTRLRFTPYKIPLIILTCMIFFVLSLRIKERVVINWLMVLAAYKLRPHWYLFNKNDLFLRDIAVEAKPKTQAFVKVAKPAKSETETVPAGQLPDMEAKIGVKRQLNFRFNRKGALVVQTYE